MKLYATTTSERASKGQGGNKYLYINLLVGSKDHQIDIGRVSLVNTDESFLLEYHKTLTSDSITLAEITKEKGKKQKGELCNCGMNAGFHSKQNNCK